MPTYTLRINGRNETVESWDPNEPLLYVLRGDLGLHSPKFGCGLGQCGSCTVMLNGAAVFSCLTPLLLAAGKEVVTVEGLGTEQSPGPMQRAFIEEQAAQCGYCIAGMIMMAKAILDRNPRPSEADVRLGLVDNLCRCGTHNRIVRAILKAAQAMRRS